MWFALSFVLLAGTGEFSAATADGRQLTGQLVSITAEQVELATSSGPVAVPTSQVVGIAAVESPAAATHESPVWVELVDRSRLVGRQFTVSAATATLSRAEGPLTIPTSRLAAVRFRAQNAAQAEQWAEILRGEHTGDVIVLRKEEALDYLSGIVGDVTDDSVTFNLDGESVPVKRSRVEGLLWFHTAPPKLPQTVATVVDAGGSQWQAAQLKFSGDGLELVTPAGVTATIAMSAVSEFRFPAQYLSDLPSERETWTPRFLSAAPLPPAILAFHSPRRDRAADGGPLQLGGKIYTKGIGLRSRTEMTFRLPQPYRMFTCTAGIDEAVRPHGHVQLTILGDDRVLLEATLSGTDEPRPIVLDINGVARLKFVVDFGDELHTADHLNLCDARIIP